MDETVREAPRGETPPGADRLEMWRITVAQRCVVDEFTELRRLWDNPTREEYLIAAPDRQMAEEVARKRYLDEMELATGWAVDEPWVVERLGANSTRVTYGDDRPRGWWRRLFR